MTRSLARTPGKRSAFSRRWRWNKRAPLRAFYNAWLRAWYRLGMRHRVVHPEHMPPTGGTIVMINHVNWADPFVVLAALGRPITPMAKVEAFEDWRVRWLVAPYGAIPVHRGAVDVQAIKAATEVLNEGGVVLISPEGTRSKTGGLIQGQEGLAFLAVRTGAWVVPAGIVGTPDILPSLFRLRRAEVTITLGAPFKLTAADNPPSREQLLALTDFAMRRLAAVLPPHMRGVYA
jgi:1-acyl-sn-glycerol-3-phosphate acyltransferase